MFSFVGALAYGCSSVCGWSCRAFARYSLKGIGLRQSPCGTPIFNVKGFDVSLPTLTFRLTSSTSSFMRWSSALSSIVGRSCMELIIELPKG